MVSNTLKIIPQIEQKMEWPLIRVELKLISGRVGHTEIAL